MEDIADLSLTDKEFYALVRHQQYEIYRKSPILWLRDMMEKPFENFEWTRICPELYENHVWDGGTVNPLAAALQAIADKHWVALPSATGTGKTHFSAYLALWYLDCFEDSFVITLAPKEEQLTRNLWAEMSKIMHLFRKNCRPNVKTNMLEVKPEGLNEDCNYRDSYVCVGYTAGAGSEELTATRMSGLHRENMLFIFEETPGISPKVLETVKNTCTANSNLILCLGNPDSEHDLLNRFMKLPRVKTIRISALDHPNILMDKEYFKGAVTRMSIYNRLIEYGEDNPLYLSRVRGITPSSDLNALIQSDWIDACDLHSPNYDPSVKADIFGGYNAIGVDVADSDKAGSDMAAVAYGRGNALTEVFEFKCGNATHLGYNIVLNPTQRLEKGITDFGIPCANDYQVGPDMIGVDVVGVGVATFNSLLEEGYTCVPLSGGTWDDAIPLDDNGKPFYKFFQLRSQMMYQLREDIRKGEIVFDIVDRLQMSYIKKELTTARFVRDKNAIAVEQKINIKKRVGKSPNVADAIAYWNWVRHGWRVSASFSPVQGGVYEMGEGGTFVEIGSPVFSPDA